MAEMLDFNTREGVAVDRELLIAALNTGTKDSPVWSPVGRRVEDSSMELDWGVETIKDIFGETYSSGKKSTRTQTFDPWTLDSQDAAQKLIWNTGIKKDDVNALMAMDMLICHFYAGGDGQYKENFAERYESCAVLPTGLGGEGGGSVGMPIDVTYGGKRTLGKASRVNGEIIFTPDEDENVSTQTASYSSTYSRLGDK